MALDEEVELKFLSDPETWQSLQKAPPFAGLDRSSEQNLRTRYFDTPDHKLRDNGIYFRLRQTDGELCQSVKQSGGVARGEWENTLSEPRPNFDVLADGELAPVLKSKATLESLQPIFETDVHRRSLLWQRHGARIEISFDKGDIKANAHQLQLYEVELELKEGAVAELFALAQRLVAAAPMTLSFVSKGERGFLLSEGHWGEAQKVALPDLSSGMAAGDAFKRICHACLHAVMLNTSLFERTTQDIEIVHQSRVALRRLRAAMSFFAPIAEGQRYETLRHEFGWMSDLLGAARDLDVWQDTVFKPKASGPDVHPGFAFLSRYVGALRQKAYVQLADALTSERWRKTLLECAIYLHVEDWKLGNRATPIDDFLDRRLRRRAEKLVKEGGKLEELDSSAQHHLRIRAKKLRYTAEFFESLVEGSKARRHFDDLVDACETVQSALGEIHDRIALDAFLSQEFAKVDAQNGAPQNVPAAFAAGLLARERPGHGKCLREAEKAYRKLKGWEPFWR
jgi:triphosphatase